MVEFAKSPQTVCVPCRPNDEKLMGHWRDFFSTGSPHKPHHKWVVSQYSDNVWRLQWRTHYDAMWDLLVKVGYLMEVPQAATKYGADEYDMIMKGQREWASIQKNSGN